MIVGKIKDLRNYKGIHKNLDEAIEYVLTHDIITLATGIHSIKGDDIFINRQSYIAHDDEDCLGETHVTYMDLQIMLKGREKFGYCHIDDKSSKIVTPYDSTKDVAFYKIKDNFIYLLDTGFFAIVMPEDIHRPGIKVDSEIVEKAIIKIKK